MWRLTGGYDRDMAARRPAPGDLALVEAFVNTADLEEGTEQLASPTSLRRWLAAHRILVEGTRVTAADLRRAIEVRESLRALLLANNGVEIDRAAVDRLNLAAASARLTVSFGERGRARIESAAIGVDAALGRLLVVVERAMCDGTWERFKACPMDDCHWAFYDHSKNRSGRWCTMSVCGNRAKGRAFRARRSVASD